MRTPSSSSSARGLSSSSSALPALCAVLLVASGGGAWAATPQAAATVHEAAEPAASAAPLGPDAAIDLKTAARMADLALACVHREYPNKLAHVLTSKADALPPRALTPVFYGCYDWHSAVHGHWLLARLARLYPEAPFAPKARKALADSFKPAAVAAEVRYLQTKGRESFERPYGLAWLLQLGTELHEWSEPEAQRWASTLQPLELAAKDRLVRWLPKLARPVRSGEHSQTAFALGLALDWARAHGDAEFAQFLEARARAYFLGDRDCPLAYEPSGEDFLSPCFAEADLMRRLTSATEYAVWLRRFLPGIPSDGSSSDWLAPAVVSDPSDGKLVHNDGLNLSRAWMLEGVARGLPIDDARLGALAAAAKAHRDAGLHAVSDRFYEGSHWLGSFATYLVTRRGVAVPAASAR